MTHRLETVYMKKKKRKKKMEPEAPMYVHGMSRKEKAVLEAWKRGDRNASEVAEITGLPLDTVYRYIPV